MQGISLPRLQLAGIIPLAFSWLLFLPVWQTLVTAWLAGEQDNSHAFPAFLAALFIATTSHYHLQKNNAIQRFLSLAVLLIASLAFYVTSLVNIEIASQFLMIVALLALFTLFFNVHQLLKTLSIIALVVMALPIWDALLEPLVNLASVVVTFLVSFLNITVLIEGNSISTPYGRILIAEGCSGIRYLMVSMVLAVVVSHLNNYRLKGLTNAIALAIFLGLLANWVRILLLILIGYYSKMESSLMDDHELFGWVVFALFILPTMYFAPQHKKPKAEQLFNQKIKLSQTLALLVALTLAINLALFWSAHRFQNQTNHQIQTSTSWQATQPSLLVQSLPNIQSQTLTWYQTANADIYVATLANSKNSMSEKLVPYMEQSQVSDFWFLEQSTTQQISRINVEFQILKSLVGSQRIAQIQLFNTGNKWSSRYATAKLQQIPAILSGNNQFSYYRLLSPCQTDCTATISALSELAKQVVEL